MSTDCTFGTIQAAVDAADAGATVEVGPGTYTGQVSITKSLTLTGAGEGDTFIQSPATLDESFTASGTARKAIVAVTDRATATISNLTVDGNNAGKTNSSFIGVGFHKAGGTLSGVNIENVSNDPLDGAQRGVGIYANNEDSVARTITVKDYQKNGSALSGKGLTAIVTGNTVTGAGEIDTIGQNGIQIGFGASGTVSGNTVTGNFYLDDASAAGILLFKAGTVTVGGAADRDANTITGNQVGIASTDTTCLNVEGNQITNNRAGIRVEGEITTASVSENTITGNAVNAITNATLNWWGSNSPVFDTLVSGDAAYSPWYTDEAMTMTTMRHDVDTSADAGTTVVKFADESDDSVSAGTVTIPPDAVESSGSGTTYFTYRETSVTELEDTGHSVSGEFRTGDALLVDISLHNGKIANRRTVEVCLPGTASDHLYHYTDGGWHDIDGSYDDGLLCADVSGFSPFATARPNSSGGGSNDDPACTSAPFGDVDVSDEFCGEIAWLKDQDITTGYDDGGFHPAASMSRQAMAAFTYRLENSGGMAPECSSAPFDDVAASDDFCGEISWLKGQDITTGYDDGGFHPAAQMSRQAMAAFIYRLQA